MELMGFEGWEVRIFNGFSIGLTRCKNDPQWFPVEEGYDLFLFSGFKLELACVSIRYGDYIQIDDYIELVNEVEKNKGAE